MMKIEKSDRINSLPPYLFKDIDRQKEEEKKRGIDIIDLGVGDPDMPTPGHIIEALNKAAHDPANHKYPSYTGMGGFNEAVARWYKRRFNVVLDPVKEVVTLIGSKEGIANIPLAFINPGDTGLVTSPGYPVYDIGVKFVGGQTYFMDLLKENNFLPDLEAVPADVVKKAKMMFINYPNNPTSAVADGQFFKKVVSFETDKVSVGDPNNPKVSWIENVFAVARPVLKYLFASLAVFLVYLIVIRPVVRWVTSVEVSDAQLLQQLPKTVGELEREFDQGSKRLPYNDRAANLLSGNSEKIVQVLRSMVNQQ